LSLLSDLSELGGRAFSRLGLDPALGAVVPASRSDFGQFQCNGALAAAKVAGRPARDVADQVANVFRADPRIAEATVAGPGFINLTVTDRELADRVAGLLGDERLGMAPAESQTVVVDYAGPNVAKAMHVGHLRATIIGDALAKVFAFAGDRVIRDPHFGDWGYQMGLVIAEIERRQPNLPYFDPAFTGPYPETSPVTLEDLQELYPEAAAKAEQDPEWAEKARQATLDLQQGRPGYLALWQHMKKVSEESQRTDFADLGVEFDLWYGESDVRDRIEPLVERLTASGIAEKSEGALIIRVDEESDNRDLPPLILESSRGGALYATTDLATIELRAELGADLILYVVDARQADHFEQLFRAARRGGVAPPGLLMEHIRFGTMNGKDGKPFKTREGGVVSLGELIDMVEEAAAVRLAEADIAQEYPAEERRRIAHQVGVAALKFGDLSVNRVSDYVFDLDRFASFEGRTGPYLQYAAVRTRSILRKAEDAGLAAGPIVPPARPGERALMLALLMLPEVVERTIEFRAPNHLADYAFELAGSFNRFYDECHILSEGDPALQASWLSLVTIVLTMLTVVLGLLGIEVPERM
jgi:arginyl-tRNA synthetase